MKVTESIYLERVDISVTIAVDFDDVEEVFEITFQKEVFLTPSELNQVTSLINKMKRVWKTRSI